MWASSSGALARTATTASATTRPARRPTMPCTRTDPPGEGGDLEQLETVVVESPPAHERRQEQGPPPRVGDGAEPGIRAQDREAVVGDDLADVTIEHAARPGADRGRSRPPGCGRCGAGARRRRPTPRRRRPARPRDDAARQPRRTCSVGVRDIGPQRQRRRAMVPARGRSTGPARRAGRPRLESADGEHEHRIRSGGRSPSFGRHLRRRSPHPDDEVGEQSDGDRLQGGERR